MGKRVIVIGGGAAGLTAAAKAAKNGNEVLIIERNERPARKVMITGKGRCNVTNNTDLNGLINSVTDNSKFLYSAFSNFNAQDTMSLFESLGVPLKTERGNRVFPKSDKAVDIVDALVSNALQNGVRFKNAKAVSVTVDDDNSVTGVKTENGETVDCDRVILATGGLSYPRTGSDGSGYKIAKALGHTVTELRPSIVSVVAQNGWVSALAGLSLKNVAISVLDCGTNKTVYTDFGEMLFTHYGLSGPIILSASAHMKKLPDTKYRVIIDLKPALGEEQLNSRILRDFEKYSNKDFANSLCDLLPKRLISIVVKQSGIPSDTKVNQITKEQRERLVSVLKNLTVDIINLRPIDEAVVTSGGIKVSEINPKTMQSKLVSGLFFAGEIIDVDAYTGGFNLQIAFSTGFAAGNNV